jgi:shikimate kinase
VVKSTSENALRNSQKKKKPGRPSKRSAPKRRTRMRSEGKRRSASPVTAVFLVGFMGAGKTSVGRALGQRLNWIFEDLDDRIQQREGRTIAEIFRDSGEIEFRRAEHDALRQFVEELRGGVAKILALGGGAFVQPANAALLKASGAKTVFLDAPVEELWHRCCQQASQAGTERPLLQNRGQFAELHRARRKVYRKASKRIDTGSRSVEAVATEVIQQLGLKKIRVRSQQGEIE